MIIDGSIIMDDSMVINGKHIEGDKESVFLGSVGKSLSEETWWETNNQLIKKRWNPVWVRTLENKNKTGP